MGITRPRKTVFRYFGTFYPIPVLTTFSATGDENFVKKTFSFQCYLILRDRKFSEKGNIITAFVDPALNGFSHDFSSKSWNANDADNELYDVINVGTGQPVGSWMITGPWSKTENELPQNI